MVISKKIHRYYGKLTKKQFFKTTYSFKNDLAFYTVAKTGSRSILYALREHLELDSYEANLHYFGFAKKFNYKFAFIRNPWDRLVSCYKNKVERKKMFEDCWDKDFDFFLNYALNLNLNTCDIHIKHQHQQFPVKDLSYLGKFENYASDYNHILNEKLKLNCELYHRNSTRNTSYVDFFNDKQKKLVEDAYKLDIELGKYKFGN